MKTFLLSIVFLVVGFFLGGWYSTGYSAKFDKVVLGSKVDEVHKNFGNPDLVHDVYDGEWVEADYSMFNKSIFIYSVKDSTLVKKWKEY